MNIQDLGSLGEFVAAIATLITLAYLALQIRHNTRVLEESAFRAIAQDASRFRDKLIEHADVAAIYRTGLLSHDSLDPTERLRFRMLLNEVFFTWWYQHEYGIGLESHQEHMRSTLATPGGTYYWENAKHQFPSAFADYVDGFAPTSAP